MHLVEISTKSTKNMGYAQVTQSPNLSLFKYSRKYIWFYRGRFHENQCLLVNNEQSKALKIGV